ncbi:MAG: hypothetical protein ACR2HG_06615 [Pyrinomonadaceae bacterium]
MNCREFTIIFEDRGSLSEAATLHLKVCAECEKMSREQTLVWQMIDDLPQVDAPKNFDFLVKARIADSKPANYSPPLFPVLRYVLPLGLAILILGFFVFKTANFSSDNAAPQMAQVVSPTPIEKTISTNDSSSEQISVATTAKNEKPAPDFSNANIESSKPKNTALFVAEKSKPRIGNDKKDVENNFNGSRMSASKPPLVFTPKGFDLNSNVRVSPNSVGANSITDEQILAQLGIEIVSENGNRIIKSVKQNSLAGRSGVKVGDVVEAIDGRKISDEPIRGNTIEGKTLTVRRGAEKVEITLQN